MEFEKVLDELKTLKDIRPEICEKIKSHNLPVIIFGAGGMAKEVTNELKKFGVEVAGYAIDEKYYAPNKTYLERPIYNFAELSATPDKYVFVLGTSDYLNNGVRSGEFLNDEKIIRYVLYATDAYELQADFVSQNKNKFEETLNLLADDLSRETLIAYLKLKISRDVSYNYKVFVANTYFNVLTNGVLTRKTNRGGARFLDCGAFNGDTIGKFINWSGGNYEKIFAIEANPINFAELEKFIAAKNFKNVVSINCGAWNKTATLIFSADNADSAVSTEGKIQINADTIDNILSGEEINFIKLVVQGSELAALQGATETIKKFKPTLAICAYVRAEDLITLPQFIKNLNLGYKLYLRKHEQVTPHALILYAIP